MSLQMAFGQAALLANAEPQQLAEAQEKLIMQGLKEVTMHEVGHTLGLRHNFKASTLLTLDEMNDPAKTRETGLTASVMDYAPVNIVPAGMKQGDYYSTTIGPYDFWAIEYGYKPLAGQHGKRTRRTAEDRRPQRRTRAWPTPPTKTLAESTPIPTRTASTWARTRSSTPADRLN